MQQERTNGTCSGEDLINDNLINDNLINNNLINNLDPESGGNCGFYYVYIFTGVGTLGRTQLWTGIGPSGMRTARIPWAVSLGWEWSVDQGRQDAELL